MSIDVDGTVLSRWGDAIWNLAPLAGRAFTLNFGDGEDPRRSYLDSRNADLLRVLVTWRMWGPRAVRSIAALLAFHNMARAVVSLCNRNSILASDLARFPKVVEQLPSVMTPSRRLSDIKEFHRLYTARAAVGFVVLDPPALKRWATAPLDQERVQTAYIPPRIWSYQVGRLRECLDQFLAHRDQVVACFNFCIDAYEASLGSLQAAVAGRDNWKTPFGSGRSLGPFSDTARRFGIEELLRTWVPSPSNRLTPRAMSTYMNMVVLAGLAYIANFTLQRKEEVAALRASCLLWETDEKLGRVPVICGETTKTIQDSDARWVASPSVSVAVEAMTVIARLRVRCDEANPKLMLTPLDRVDPYLRSFATEPWGTKKLRRYDLRPPVPPVSEIIETYPRLFDVEKMRISEKDLRIARKLTPNLPENEYAVGKVWPLAWHQYRRTGAVNMFSSGIISDSSMQLQMKHSSRLMPLYYARGYTRLHLNESVEATIVTAMYEALALRIKGAMSERFVPPHPVDRNQHSVVTLLSSKDETKLVNWAKNGKISYRQTRLGGCLKSGPCEYGGVESITHCAGGGGTKPCVDAIFDRTKAPQVKRNLEWLLAEMARLSEDSPRYKALEKERIGMESFLNVVERK
ncbi:hypothetical protein ACS7SF_23235 (plasmid) [Ralstonia sp. 25C]|uniref:hypothetical protein n=1 Tax=Ralstonia sp. 25C TaxID=3447363 RepID=UPI003F756FF2